MLKHSSNHTFTFVLVGRLKRWRIRGRTWGINGRVMEVISWSRSYFHSFETFRMFCKLKISFFFIDDWV